MSPGSKHLFLWMTVNTRKSSLSEWCVAFLFMLEKSPTEKNLIKRHENCIKIFFRIRLVCVCGCPTSSLSVRITDGHGQSMVQWLQMSTRIPHQLMQHRPWQEGPSLGTNDKLSEAVWNPWIVYLCVHDWVLTSCKRKELRSVCGITHVSGQTALASRNIHVAIVLAETF